MTSEKNQGDRNFHTSVDVCGVLTDSDYQAARKYWKVLKDKVQRFMESTGMYGKYEVGVDGLSMEDM